MNSKRLYKVCECKHFGNVTKFKTTIEENENNKKNVEDKSKRNRIFSIMH